MRTRLNIILLLAFTSFGAIAKDRPEIVKIYSGKQWNMNDSICFHRDGEKIKEIVACGKVVGTTSYLVKIRVPELSEKVRKGERLYVAAAGPGREPTSYGDSYVVTRTVPLFLRAVTFGFNASTKFIFPQFHVQTSLGKGCLLGIMPSYSTATKNTSSASILGTFATFEGFFDGVSFDGFSAFVAAGLYSVRATNGTQTEAAWTPSFQGALGWRYVAKWGFTLGIYGGVQFTSETTSNLIELGFTRFQPLFRADIGFAF